MRAFAIIVLTVLLFAGLVFVASGAEPFHGDHRPMPPTPTPGPHDGGVHQDYGRHDGDHGDWGRHDEHHNSHYDPWGRLIYDVTPVIPIIVNPLIGQRYVPNPLNNAMELRGPGRWTQHQDGSFSYDPLPFWPPGAKAGGTWGPNGVPWGVVRSGNPSASHRRPVRCIVRRIVHRIL